MENMQNGKGVFKNTKKEIFLTLWKKGVLEKALEKLEKDSPYKAEPVANEEKPEENKKIQEKEEEVQIKLELAEKNTIVAEDTQALAKMEGSIVKPVTDAIVVLGMKEDVVPQIEPKPRTDSIVAAEKSTENKPAEIEPLAEKHKTDTDMAAESKAGEGTKQMIFCEGNKDEAVPVKVEVMKVQEEVKQGASEEPLTKPQEPEITAAPQVQPAQSEERVEPRQDPVDVADNVPKIDEAK